MDSIDCFPLYYSITKLELQAATSTGYGYYAPYASISYHQRRPASFHHRRLFSPQAPPIRSRLSGNRPGALLRVLRGIREPTT